ncbi:MAG: restriction endonuclease subunit M [Sulfurovum sp.]|nr:MAG: restriction endonuclease subunit M [Sulfurovum sp.]
MTLFQNSVLRNHLQNIDSTLVLQAYEVYKTDFLPKIENIKTSKEEQYQYGFLDDLFVKVLGYTLNPTPEFNLTSEFKNLSDSKKADGAVLKDGKAIAVIELKSTKTKVMDKIVNQAFNYKHNHPTCKYIITSNFEKLRLYVEHSDAYEEFNLFDLNEERFTLLYALLAKESIFSDVPLSLKSQSKLQEENISNELYKKYATLRTNLFDNIIQNNPSIDKHILLEKTQTILDRMVFIFFGEDRGILPPNTIKAIIDHHEGDIEDRELWHFYKIYFNAINKGNAKLKIPEYNGGLFAENTLLDSLVIDRHVLDTSPLSLSAYDFNSDIDVNILGHIFENSLNDIEELKARIDDEDFDVKQSKRKKDGVFYTPEYITKYIVDNTLGSLCQAKKEGLGLDEVDIFIPKNPKKLNKGETKQKEALESYREYLLSLKILDPACGSGAFLNQALNYLLEEHAFIDESVKTLMGGSVLGLYDVKKGILENNLYGVDINAEAVEIAKLSLWLRTVESGRKLNKLADKIKVGNSLIDDKSVAEDAFVWEEEFAEVFEQGGFDVVIGNPPYVRQELLSSEMKSYFKTKYTTHHNSADLYIFFVERGYNLLRKNGKFSFIFPNKWLKAKYGKPLRKWLKSKHLNEIVDFGDLQIFQGATTYPLIMTLNNQEVSETFDFLKLETMDFGDLNEYVKNYHSKITLGKLSDDAWQLVSKDVQNVLDKTMQSSIFLGQYTNGEIYRGVLTGLTEAFVINEETKNKLIDKDISSKEILKPFVMGKDIQRYDTPIVDKYLVLFPKGFTKEKSNLENEEEAWQWIQAHYPAIAEWLEPFEARGKKRYDKGDFWWELRACDYYSEFEKPKIMYLVFQVKPAFIMDVNDTYSNNAIFIYPKEDYFLLGILNSKLGWFFIANSCTEIQNGYQLIYDYFKNIPIPLNVENNKKEKLEISVKEVVRLNQTLKHKAGRFLKRVKDNFDLDKLSRKLEAFYETDFKTFLKELKKKKVTLTLKEQDEWEEYFEGYQKKLLEIQAQINITDKQIDEMVYVLYGLSEDEIKVVEGR